ncbi:MAG: hypothetical protein HY720_00710, partial [Planctomycetes bacterium]|nr:hypothetical protein [Planctomycetota bacterium]
MSSFLKGVEYLVLVAYPLRQFSPDEVYLVTSRCTDSMLLLRPDPVANEVILEWLVRGVRFYEVELFAYVWTSNHVHFHLRCPKANLDKFMRYVLSHVATELNKIRGRSGSMFSRRYSAEPIRD